MEKKNDYEGNLRLETEEIKKLEKEMDEAQGLSVSKNFGGWYTLLCC